MSNKHPRVIICGAGIGGLTAAHELARRGFRVTVYERNTVVGGLARSKYHKQDGYHYPVEYSWRVYGTGYKNLHRLFQEIPGVTKNLTRVSTYVFPRFNREPIVLSRDKWQRRISWNFTPKDQIQMLGKILRCLLMPTKQIDSLDHLKWKDYCANLSDEAKKYLVTMWGPVLGMDPSKMSFPVVARFMGVLVGGWFKAASSLFVMNKPTNDAWFDLWVEYLRGLGVEINTEHEIQDIQMKKGEVVGIKIKTPDSDVISVSADMYLLGLSVETVAKLVEENTDLQQSSTLKNCIALSHIGRQIQLSVQLFFDQKIDYQVKDKPLLYLPDTPWAIIVEPEDVIWDATFCTDDRVKSI